MHMGSLNADQKFVAIMINLQMEWDTLSKERGLKSFSSTIIVDEMLLYWRTAIPLLDYFRKLLDVIKHHGATLKLKIANGFRAGASL